MPPKYPTRSCAALALLVIAGQCLTGFTRRAPQFHYAGALCIRGVVQDSRTRQGLRAQYNEIMLKTQSELSHRRTLVATPVLELRTDCSVMPVRLH